MLCAVLLFCELFNCFALRGVFYYFLTMQCVMFVVQEKCIIPKTKSNETLQNRHMFSKFLYYRYVLAYVCL